MPIDGVKVKEKESEDDVMNTLEKCYSSLNVSFDPILIQSDIDRAHRIELSYTDNPREKNHNRQILDRGNSSIFLQNSNKVTH